MRKAFAFVISILLVVLTLTGCDASKVRELKAENAVLRQSNNELDSINCVLHERIDSLRDSLKVANNQNIDSAMLVLTSEIPFLEQCAAEAQEEAKENGFYFGEDRNGTLSGIAIHLHQAWTLWLQRGQSDEFQLLRRAQGLLLTIYRMDLKTPDPEEVMKRENRMTEWLFKQKMVDWLQRFNQVAVPPLSGPNGLYESGG